MSATSTKPLPLVVLISGSGSNLQAIIDACAEGRVNAEVKAVISNRPDAYGLERAKAAAIPAHIIDHTHFSDRSLFETRLTQVIDQYNPALIVLAGFMRILTPEFVNHYLGRMINIHPSLLPDFQGLNTHQRALDANAKEHGVSIHFVTPELDGGPVISRATVSIDHNDTTETLAKKVLAKEHSLYPDTIAWFADGRIQLSHNQALLDNIAVPQLQKSFE